MFTLIAAMALLAQPRSHIVAQLGHSKPVHAVAWSPGGRLVVTAGADATAVVWNAESGHHLRTLAGHTKEIDALAFSPDGRFVATGSRDLTAKLWDVATGEEVRTLPHGNGDIRAVAFTPDSRQVLTGGWDSSVTFWDTATGEPLRSLSGFEKGVTSIAVSPDGRKVVTGSSDRTARLWDAASGGALRTLAGHTDTITAVAFSPDSRFVATASWDRTIRLWDAGSGSSVRTLTRHTDGVLSLAFSPDGRRLLSGARDLTAVLWDTASGKALGVATGHTDWVSSVAFSPDGRYLLTGSHDRTTRRWDSRGDASPLFFASHSSSLEAAAYSRDCRLFATAGRDGIATLWDVSSGQPIRSLKGHEHWVMALAFAPDGRSLATASWDKTVRLWSVPTGTLLRTFAGHEEAVTALVFSPDGRLLATRGWDQSAKVWDVSTGAEVRAFAPKEKPVDSLAFSPDGRFLVTGWNAGARVWDTATWQQVRVIGPHTIGFELRAVAFSPDGRVLLTASGDGTVKLWNVKSGAALRTLSAHAGQVLDAIFSRDGRFILTAGGDGTAKLWNASTGAEVRTFAGHTGPVNAAVFSCDAKLVLTASGDGTARLWELDSSQAMATVIAFENEEWAVVDRDGRFDAASGTKVEGLHWVTGDRATALGQLGQRYYDPELLAKLLGGKVGLIDVEGLDRLPEGPEVIVDGPAAGSTKIAVTLRDRGDGIGNVRVLVNLKEVADDACGTRAGPPKKSVSCVVDLAAARFSRSEENTIEVVAWNRDGTVHERGVVRRPPVGAGEARLPELHAIVVGITDYAVPHLKLSYAAPDANRMARAIELAGRGLFGDGRVHLTRLVTGDPGVPPPTRDNIEAAFVLAARRAEEEDVLFVYLAGHGTTAGKDYVYPTSQATAIDMPDSLTRNRAAVTGTQLLEWTKRIHARKQVMVVDTCASGALGAQLHPDERSERSEIARLLQELSERTGFHILMGSAANASSFEDHRLGQGLLTYTLLEGMKGAALLNGTDVDVSRLFQHAAREVPLLARRLDKEQFPRIAAPRGVTFSFGRLTPAARAEIPVPPLRPTVLRPILIESGAGRDVLALTGALTGALREASHAECDIRFFEGDDDAEALRPEGTYTVDGTRVVVRLALSRKEQPIASLTIEGSASDVASLAEKVAAAICAAIRSLPLARVGLLLFLPPVRAAEVAAEGGHVGGQLGIVGGGDQGAGEPVGVHGLAGHARPARLDGVVDAGQEHGRAVGDDFHRVAGLQDVARFGAVEGLQPLQLRQGLDRGGHGHDELPRDGPRAPHAMRGGRMRRFERQPRGDDLQGFHDIRRQLLGRQES
ncbi:MAG TPA: caspase family protein [Thermoanaerobaculia bacterium]|nr:caspase family protein [Thermoanaerobaculia bacterium]